MTKTRKIKSAILHRNPAKLLLHLIFNKRAVSVALSTMIITAGVIAMGIAVLYWSYSWGNMAKRQYGETVSAGSVAIEERLSFEYIAYSAPESNLTVNVLNWGKANNLSIVRVYLWDKLNNPVGTFPDSNYNIVLMNITTGAPIPTNSLNAREEGYFNLTVSLDSNSYYNIRVVTDRGRNFDGSFSTPP